MPQPIDISSADKIGFQRKEWVFERFGWLLITLILLAALLGVFGGGVVSPVTGRSPDGAVAVEYERFVRLLGSGQLEIVIDPAMVLDGKVTVDVAAGLIDDLHVEQITPEPSMVATTAEGLRYTFAVTDGPPVIRLTYKPIQAGVRSGTVQAGGGEPVRIWQLTYP